MDPRKRLGARIRKQRKMLGLTQEGLAVAAELTKVSIVRIESGDVWPDFKNLQAISSAIGLSIDDLLDPTRAPMSAKTQLFQIVATLNEFQAQALLTPAKQAAATSIGNGPLQNETLEHDEAKAGSDKSR